MARHTVRRFASLHELVKYADTTPSTLDEWERSSRIESTYRDDFTRSKTWEEARDLAMEGWSEIRPDVDKMVSRVVENVRPTIEQTWQPLYDVVGASVDIGAYMTGEPECMVDFANVETSRVGRVVSVIVCIGARSNIPSDSIMRRGAAVAALIEILGTMQHSVEVWAESTSRGDGKSRAAIHTTLVKVKDAEERLDINAFMFALAHPSMLRRMVFAVRECEDAEIRRRINVPSNYGYSDTSCLMADEVGANVSVDADYDKMPATNPEAWLLATLGDLGLIDEEEGVRGR